jgi:signal transduction histidine kinase
MYPMYSIELKEVVASLVHALRQPLSTIGTSVYYLQMTVSPDLRELREQLARIEQEVENAGRILTDLGQSIERSRSHAGAPEETAASLSSTNDEIAEVTY